MENIQEISLDVMNNHNYDMLFANQYDIGREFHIYVTKDNEPLDLTGLSATFLLKKPDGTKVVNVVDIIDNEYASVTITEQMTTRSGKLPFQLCLQEGEDFILYTIKGYLLVESAAVQDGDVDSHDESSLLNQVIVNRELAEDAKDEAEQAATDIITMAQSASGVYVSGCIYQGDKTFAELEAIPTSSRVAGFMYRITEPFTSNEHFKDGGGKQYDEGTKVYTIVEFQGGQPVYYWDCLDAGGVFGVKGDAEHTYRRGNVNLTKANIGLAKGVNVVYRDDYPDDGEEVWFEPYEPQIDPHPQPHPDDPRYNDNVFFTVSGALNELIPSHLVSRSTPTAFRRSTEKRGCPVSTNDTGLSELLYLDFQVNSDDTQTVWWWTASGNLPLDLSSLFISETGYGTYYNLDFSYINPYYADPFNITPLLLRSLTGYTEINLRNANSKILHIEGDEYEYDTGYYPKIKLVGANQLSNDGELMLNKVDLIGDLDVSNWQDVTGYVSNIGQIHSMEQGAKIIARNWELTGYQGGFDKHNLGDIFFNTYDHDMVYRTWDLTGWDISRLTDIGYLFSFPYSYSYYGLELIGLDGLDTSNITDMESTFYGTNCNAIDLSGWDVSSVEDMSKMFYDSNMNDSTYRSLADWDVSSVENMSSMFCSANISNDTVRGIQFDWDVSNVNDFSSMFAYNHSLYDFSFLDNWHVDPDADFSYMFDSTGYGSSPQCRYPRWNGYVDQSGTFRPYQGLQQYNLRFMGYVDTLSNLPDNPSNGDCYFVKQYMYHDTYWVSMAVYYDQATHMWYDFEHDNPISN